MGRRRIQWVRRVEQAGGPSSVDKVLPDRDVRGKGTWNRGDNSSDAYAGSKVTSSISERKEELFRKWAKEIGVIKRKI